MGIEASDGKGIDMAAKVDYAKKFEQELQGFEQRWLAHVENLKSADHVIIVTGCDDSRVGVPAELQLLPDGTKAIFLFISAIGGGAPSKELIQAVISNVEKNGVEKSKIEIITTQHGSHDEVMYVQSNGAEGSDTITCGLRKVLASGDFTGIPERLVQRAGSINTSSSMLENGQSTFETVREYGLTSEISSAYFDHQEKTIRLVEGSRTQDIELQYEKWEPKYQDPEGLVVSFGVRANTIHDGLVLPESVGVGNSNDFSASALSTEDDLLVALSEIWYAASHHALHAEGHGHDPNFTNTKFCTIICDNQVLVETAKRAMQTEEFKKDYEPVLKPFGGVQLVNLETQKVETFAIAA